MILSLQQVSKAILDTSALVDLLDGVEAVLVPIEQFKTGLLPIFVLAELYYMAENSEKREHNYRQVEVLRARFPLLEMTVGIAREYVQVRYEVRKTHPKMPPHDVWIAAYARFLNVPLIAKDKHFSAIPNLTVITW